MSLRVFCNIFEVLPSNAKRILYTAYGLGILVHRNIQTLTIGYIQFRQGFES